MTSTTCVQLKETLIESSFWRMSESSQNNNLLDAGIHQHDEVPT